MSVKSFQVPATPFTSAWPPSFPSVPTSRATRVTSEANERSWSTIVLMVFFSSRISPFTSTVIFLDKSPLATAVVTAAMFRTWPVRLPAMEFTESVRSFQVPATPFTLAWPPSFPSVPTSRATRVTSEANEPSWSTIVLTVLAVRRNSPCERPAFDFQGHRLREVALGHGADHAGGFGDRVHQVADQRVDRVDDFVAHEPLTSPMLARWEIFPSLPTTRLRRSSSSAMRSLSSMTSLKVSAILPSTPPDPTGRRTEKSPFLSGGEGGQKVFLVLCFAGEQAAQHVAGQLGARHAARSAAPGAAAACFCPCPFPSPLPALELSDLRHTRTLRFCLHSNSIASEGGPCTNCESHSLRTKD